MYDVELMKAGNCLQESPEDKAGQLGCRQAGQPLQGMDVFPVPTKQAERVLLNVNRFVPYKRAVELNYYVSTSR